MISRNFSSIQTFFAALGICVFSFFIPLSVTSGFSNSILYLLFILVTTTSTWLGDIRLGIYAAVVTTLSAVYFFVYAPPSQTAEMLTLTSEVILYLLTSLSIVLIVEKYKKTDMLKDFTAKSHAYIREIEELRKVNEIMKKEIKLRDEFLSIASHELKTPLTSMLIKIQSILHNVRNVSLANFSVANLLKMLETAEQQTRRLSKMINDLLNVSLITTGKLNLEMGKADITEAVKEVVNEFSERLEKEGYTVDLVAPKPVIAVFDRLRIEQAITNLISNAIKYGSGKPITIHVSQTNSHALIRIQDSGVGIDPKQKERIFELFKRGTTNHRGLGVGLYIASHIVKSHKGKITVKSKPAAGSTFTIELPLTQPK